MSKKGLDIPFSISNISNTPDMQSASFTGIFDEKKQKDDPGEYRIKVKRPNDFLSKSYNQASILNKNQLEKNMNQEFDLSQNEDYEPKIEAQQIPLREDITGYEICKTSFSEEEIIEAFKVIDINKDEIITEEDIVFFLEYIREPYTKQQVREMIEMISSDKKKVTLQDFKKIGKGSIIPFADIKIPDEKTRHKKVIYENIKRNSLLYDENPSILLNASKNEIISYKKFQQSKKISKNNQFESIKLIEHDQALEFLTLNYTLLTQQEFQKRKEKFNSIQMVNATEIIKNYHEYCNQNSQDTKKYLGFKEIGKILEISEKEAKLLYPDEKHVLAKRIVLEAIAFSPLNKIKRFELGMMIMLKKKTINFSQVYFLLQILKGKDESLSFKKKLLTVLKSKKISENQQMDKFYALELLSNYSSNFNF